MHIKKIFSCFLCIIIIFSLVACNDNKEKTDNDKVNMIDNKNEVSETVEVLDDVENFWTVRHSFENIINGKIEKSVSMSYSDGSQGMSMNMLINKKDDNTSNKIDVNIGNSSYSGNIMTIEGINYVELEMLKNMVGNSLFSLSDEAEMSEDEEAKQVKKDVMKIYNEAFFDGLTKEYVETSDDIFSVNIDTSFNLTKSENLLKLFKLYDSKLVSKEGKKFILNLSNDTLKEEIPIVIELLRKDTETYLPICLGVLEDLSDLLSNFTNIDGISLINIKSEMGEALHYEVQFEKYKEKINSDDYDLKLYLEKLVSVFPQFSIVSSIEKIENGYDCITTIKMTNSDGVEQTTQFIEKVVEDKNINIVKPSEYNTIEEFKATPYFYFMNGDIEPFMIIVDEKLKEKYGVNYEDILSMYE